MRRIKKFAVYPNPKFDPDTFKFIRFGKRYHFTNGGIKQNFINLFLTSIQWPTTDDLYRNGNSKGGKMKNIQDSIEELIIHYVVTDPLGKLPKMLNLAEKIDQGHLHEKEINGIRCGYFNGFKLCWV